MDFVGEIVNYVNGYSVFLKDWANGQEKPISRLVQAWQREIIDYLNVNKEYINDWINKHEGHLPFVRWMSRVCPSTKEN